jgi:hypothetical protein
MSRLHRNAVIRSLEVIGEAAGKISSTTRSMSGNSLAGDYWNAPSADPWLCQRAARSGLWRRISARTRRPSDRSESLDFTRHLDKARSSVRRPGSSWSLTSMASGAHAHRPESLLPARNSPQRSALAPRRSLLNARRSRDQLDPAIALRLLVIVTVNVTMTIILTGTVHCNTRRGANPDRSNSAGDDIGSVSVGS